MHSYDERIRAVKLCIKLGKRLKATIRQLGYLTKNSLIGWYREFEDSPDLQVGYVRCMHKYSAQKRQVAVQHFLDHDRCIASTMKALGYPCRGTLTAWIDDLHPPLRQRVVRRAPNIRQPLKIKNAAVIELCTRKTSAKEIAQKLAVCRPKLHNWKNQLFGPEAPASMKRHNDSESVPDQTQLVDLQQQVDVLQSNIRRLQLEHDLLKKANELLNKGLGSLRSS